MDSDQCGVPANDLRWAVVPSQQFLDWLDTLLLPDRKTSRIAALTANANKCRTRNAAAIKASWEGSHDDP
jgi:hypothetical protein